MRKNFRTTLFVLLLLVSLILSACATATVVPEPDDAGDTADAVVEQDSPDDDEGDEPDEPDEPAEPEEIVLEVWNNFTDETRQQAYLDAVAIFEAANPNVTVTSSSYEFEQLISNSKLAFDSGTAPDVMYTYPGGSSADILVEAGYLVDLSDAIESYGWAERSAPGAIEYWNVAYDGVYGSPHIMAPVGVYYNKGIFAELELSPTTFDDWEGFVALVEGVKAAGFVPFAQGSLDGWNIGHFQQSMIHSNVDLGLLSSWYRGEAGSSINVPEFVEATQLLQDWAAAGYLTPGFEGIGYDDTFPIFYQGESAMMITGDWAIGRMLDAPFEVGFFAFPRMNDDIPFAIVNSPDNIWAVNSGSENVDLALEFIDTMLSAEAARIWFAAGFTPSIAFDDTGIDVSDLQKEIAIAAGAAEVGFYVTASTDTMGSTWGSGLQLVLTGDLTPEELAQQVQADWEKAFSE